MKIKDSHKKSSNRRPARKPRKIPKRGIMHSQGMATGWKHLTGATNCSTTNPGSTRWFHRSAAAASGPVAGFDPVLISLDQSCNA